MMPLAIAFMFLVEVAVGLSPEAKESLTHAMPGFDLEALRERLRRIGEHSLPAKIETAPESADNSPTVDLDAGAAEKIEGSSDANNSTRRKRQWANFDNARWPNNHLFYSFAASVTAKTKSIVKQSLAYLQARSCLTFTEDATATDRVEVFTGSGCYSSLGWMGGVQQLSLGKGCDVIGLATHEFIHALGSLHEHARYDRDDHITVDLTNVTPELQGQFGKSDNLETVNYTPYEYGSVMHYGASTFTSKGYSLKPKIGRYLQTEGSRYTTFYDLKMLNIYYKCPDVCGALGAAAATCKNGGFPNPKNCAVCVCPGGYGGALCDQRPAGCGETLVATAAWKTKTFTFEKIRFQGPATKKIQIRVTALKGVQCGIGCRTNSIEPKYFADRAITNPKICCPNLLNQIVTSALNPAPIVSYNRVFTSTFTFQYRWV
ncbi:hypothetical protein Q1695_002833 [Nippostrongylus brasiliensis]|nr:hypothetical protein Q1695_002833 [Nippostrongylus brasiliensis]